jgi:hypothetical protein
MSESEPVSRETTSVSWNSVPASNFEAPLVWTGPYVECKLEHRGLEPTCVGEQFFPDSVPYEANSGWRVFYWRPRLPDVTPVTDAWTGLCATTHELAPTTHHDGHEPTLFQACESGSELVVDGTIVGDAKTALVSEYSPPEIELRHVTEDGVEFVIDGEHTFVPVGEREQFSLSERHVETKYGTEVTTMPELVVRFPGQRTVYHPAPRSNYHLFPSFGLDIEEIPNPIDVPTQWDELDHNALAGELGLDITSRPYPERVLWQAFAFTAFEPNTASPVELTQFSSGEIAVSID